MSGPGGTATVRSAAALMVGMLLSCGMTACAYEDDGGPQPTAAGQSHGPAPSVPSKGPEILDVQEINHEEMRRRLAMDQGSILLADTGPADGPGAGFSFSNTANVITAGPYTVTATCVGTPSTQIILSQDGAKPVSLDVDCSGVLSKVVVLQKGYLGAQLTRQDPTSEWKGAVAGIKITGR